MPVTAPAHQAFALPLKLRWPERFDATALCIGAASPDIAFGFAPWIGWRNHDIEGFLFFCLPFTVLAATILRYRGAERLFPYFPDLGPLQLRSYSVIGQRRPGLLVTTISAGVGSANHIVVDAFTHEGRWGSTFFGLDTVVGRLPIRGDMALARWLQYLGHTVGSAIGLLLFIAVTSGGLLARWYGKRQVRDARRVTPTNKQRLIVAVEAIALTATTLWLLPEDTATEFWLITGTTLGLLATSLIAPQAPYLPARSARSLLHVEE